VSTRSEPQEEEEEEEEANLMRIHILGTRP
jgi:hypothetical protein